ncbi:MAG: peptidoglycan-binding protein [Microcoleus sp. PH2017_10_PVI_O_A]|uniref:peptidoglycan-binding domain-containing protein n=1 Tax=unclassified Microcoleus TaxID=2642155 RepID=UPI001E17D3EC|nr:MULTISPECIES: peptidoglycan-binding domain-containing protein [unclassified Microcoleus]TAE81157.1 MAG: peptidoglycan-binding protein [Oscillatoriales cyanobacterium]MCC3407245.1 peptidoglycan-binding protein [Microcoleus sp. PH2017_10_PVI_O_A]MCC3461318.1 peptidoglycan-binding protein [Microcoleus sp. PH2017_11_PCY_U_A]MCC3479776.1 peptidoglycan-binding protein [Microcoleus sp. PH2017_12_PCY_D_A]MCC3529579.1 peptidoglycan-binding protein [Microcoleus sp. PH2017_21_RUC_O_A]
MQTTNQTQAQLPMCYSLPTLQRNDSSPAPNKDVRFLQQSLVKKGYPVVNDGFFGAKTEQAVINFQKKNKIAVDGIVGQQTWNKLGACVNEPPC